MECKRSHFLFYAIAFIVGLLCILVYTIMSSSGGENNGNNGWPAGKRLGKIDPSSFANAEDIIIEHIDISWNVNFEKTLINGTAIYKCKILNSAVKSLLLDVDEISLQEISYNTEIKDSALISLPYQVSDTVPHIGSKLTIELPKILSNNIIIHIKYETSSNAGALQWLTAEQTLGKKHPYVFSQCQSITARSLIPCQDSPAVKFTYNAELTHPVELTALLSAVRIKSDAGKTFYKQTVPIPSYLLAIAVGAIVSRPLGPISKVWAEEAIVDVAAEEFSSTASMLKIASDICGEYVWKEYDLLIMPPSFPFGGMENPCLTFLTPTVLAGDKSLVDVVAHEISHSWTGNLVTNQNFEHFWLNEGFTMFIEGKIIGRLEGDLSRDFQAILGLNELEDCLKNQLVDTPALQRLVVDLTGISPEDAFSSVPYMKGQTFLRYLEDLLGGPKSFEPFLRFYLNKYKYKSIKTEDFKETVEQYFRDKFANQLNEIDWQSWLYSEGMPIIIPKYNSTLADGAHKHVGLWSNNSLVDIRASPLLKETLSTLQKIEFLSKLVANDQIKHLSSDWISQLGESYLFNQTKNAELRFRYLRLCIKARLMERMDEIIAFANSNYRMKFVRPIYRDLGLWPEAKPIAVANFQKVRNEMMAMCSNQVAKDLGLK